MSIYRRPDPVPRARTVVGAPAPLGPLREHSDLNQLAAKRIFLAIVSGQFSTSGYLPKEPELGDDLGVSRTVVREAIKYLASKSVVETRRRRGTAILPTDQWNAVDAEIIDWMSESQLFPALSRQLTQTLAAALPHLVECATRSGKRDGSLNPIVARMDAGDERTRREAARDFHVRLAQLCDNPFVKSVAIKAIEGLAAHDPAALGALSRQDQVPVYRAIAEAVGSGDANIAPKALSRLFQARPVFA